MPRNLKQKTLVGFLSSPPAGSPTAFPASPTSQRPKPRARKRGRVVSPESDHYAVNNDARSDGSDVDAVRFEPKVIDLSDEDESPRRPRTIRRTPHVRTDSTSQDEEKSAASSGGSVRYETRRKSRRVGKRKQVEDSGSEEATQPKKRKFVKGVRPSSPEEDDDNILNEVDEHCELLLHSLFGLTCNITVLRYHRDSSADPRQKDNFPEKFRKTQK
jgi:hypothetical protein